MKRLLTSCLQSLGGTAAAAGAMLLFMSVFNLWWAKNCNLEPGQTFWGHYHYCMWMAAVMIGGQAVGLLVANSIVAFLRGRIRIVLALVSGALLLLLDCVAPAAGVLPESAAGLLVYLIAFPFLVTAIHWLPDRKGKETSNNSIEATPDGAPHG